MIVCLKYCVLNILLDGPFFAFFFCYIPPYSCVFMVFLPNAYLHSKRIAFILTTIERFFIIPWQPFVLRSFRKYTTLLEAHEGNKEINFSERSFFFVNTQRRLNSLLNCKSFFCSRRLVQRIRYALSAYRVDFQNKNKKEEKLRMRSCDCILRKPLLYPFYQKIHNIYFPVGRSEDFHLHYGIIRLPRGFSFH